jgi:hypothetical protein
MPVTKISIQYYKENLFKMILAKLPFRGWAKGYGSTNKT